MSKEDIKAIATKQPSSKKFKMIYLSSSIALVIMVILVLKFDIFNPKEEGKPAVAQETTVTEVNQTDTTSPGDAPSQGNPFNKEQIEEALQRIEGRAENWLDSSTFIFQTAKLRLEPDELDKAITWRLYAYEAVPLLLHAYVGERDLKFSEVMTDETAIFLGNYLWGNAEMYFFKDFVDNQEGPSYMYVLVGENIKSGVGAVIAAYSKSETDNR